MARRRPPEPTTTPPPTVGLSWHPALSAGRNIETWCPDLAELTAEDRSVKSWTRFRNARRAWKDLTEGVWSQHPDVLPWWAQGSGGTPWSHRFLLDANPVMLARILDRHGLPADWTPTPAPSALLTIGTYAPVTPTAASLLLNR